MAFTSYLIRKFEFTHENEFFRRFSMMLEKTFEGKPGEHFLVGNLSCNGHLMDAIFMAKGQITVIDFKDYEGELTFSENNPWRMMTPDNKLVFVQGGAIARNPFQQVRAYKFSLLDFLASNEKEFIEGVRNDIMWGHISCLVLFHKKIQFNKSSIPTKHSRYFSIEDISTILNTLIDKHSKGLEFSDNELRGILKTLDISEANLLKQYNFQENIGSGVTEDAAKLTMIKRLLSGSVDDSLWSRAINYYKTLINVERFKGPSTTRLHRFPLDNVKDVNHYKIDISSSQQFHKEYLENRHERFPKNLFVGLSINIAGHSVPLLHTILLITEIEHTELIEVNFDTFELYSKALESKGLGEDIIEDLITAINEVDDLESKLECIRIQLDVPVELTSDIMIGLSTESLFSVQLVSELNKMSQYFESDVSNQLFKSFLLNKPVDKNLPKLDLKPFVQISPLNDSQKRAVHMAFSSPLTVITGPPGTGKSQVVSNILANSMVNGYSTLFISKNNKAVDIVKERLDEALKEPYLIRLGSRAEIENNAKPILSKFISYVGQQPDDVKLEEKVNKAVYSIQNDIDKIDNLEKAVNSIPGLKKEIVQKRENLSTLKNNKKYWLEQLDSDQKELFIEKGVTVEAGVSELGLKLQQIKKWQNGFLQHLFFKWFYRKKFQTQLEEINSSECEDIFNILEREAPWTDPSLDILEAGYKNLQYLLELKKSSVKIIKKEKDSNDRINELLIKLNNLEKELSDLEINKATMLLEIQRLIDLKPEKGIVAVNAIVDRRLSKLNILNCEEYKDYLPANNVWKDADVDNFINCCKGFLKDFPTICLTSLSIKNSFPLEEGLIDLLVIDEASQCDIASAIPLIYRSKRVVVIGDPLQLTHITSVKKYEEQFVREGLGIEELQLNYIEKSLYDYCYVLANKSQIKSIFLQEHYRCHPQIIEFSNTHFYEKKLGQSMIIKTRGNQFQFGDRGINWVHINGEMSTERNSNSAEVNTCVSLATKLADTYAEASIGIVTPFKHQYEAIFNKLPNHYKDRIKVDTVHKYQGDEKDIMIFSTVVSDNSPSGKANFINRNAYLINVAVTRARSSLYIVGNYSYCEKLKYGKGNTPLSLLAAYVKEENSIVSN